MGDAPIGRRLQPDYSVIPHQNRRFGFFMSFWDLLSAVFGTNILVFFSVILPLIAELPEYSLLRILVNNYSKSARWPCKMINNQRSRRAAPSEWAKTHLISYKREWNNCFIENDHEKLATCL